MTREIKFRAWVNTFSHWHMTKDLVISGDGVAFISGENVDKHPEWVLMQYTGLKDKNGVEIYDGDVVNLGDPNIRYTVIYRDGAYTCKQHGNRSTAGLAHWQERTEVMGNIHEHPDLLDTKVKTT